MIEPLDCALLSNSTRHLFDVAAIAPVLAMPSRASSQSSEDRGKYRGRGCEEGLERIMVAHLG